MSLGIRISYFVASFLLLVSYCNGRYAAPKKHDFHPQEEVYQAALYEATTQGIENQYIVVLKDGTNVEKHLENIRGQLTREDKILNSFTIKLFTGYGAILTTKFVGSWVHVDLTSIPWLSILQNTRNVEEKQGSSIH